MEAHDRIPPGEPPPAEGPGSAPALGPPAQATGERAQRAIRNPPGGKGGGRDASADVLDWETAYEVGYFGQRAPKPYANDEYTLRTGPGSPAYPLGP